MNKRELCWLGETLTCEVCSDYAMGWTLEESWVDSQQGQDISLFTVPSRPTLGCTEPPIQWVLALKRLGHEASHSLPSSAKLENEWTYTSAPLYCFMVCIGTVLSLPSYPDRVNKSFNFKFYSTEDRHLWNIIPLFFT